MRMLSTTRRRIRTTSEICICLVAGLVAFAPRVEDWSPVVNLLSLLGA